MFYKIENALNTFIKPKGYTQFILVRNTKCKRNTQQGTFKVNGAKSKCRITLIVI